MSINPVEKMQQDWQLAKQKQDANANICMLATAKDNQPSVRVLVLREISQQGLLIFINDSGPKWQQLTPDKAYECLLYWPELQLQYRIQGLWQQYDRQQLQLAWLQKPYAAKLVDCFYQQQGQSSVVPDRAYLQQQLKLLAEKYPNSEDIPFPDNAQGVYLQPLRIEYWQLSAQDRLHYRYLYQRKSSQTDAAWSVQTIVP